MIDKCIAFSRFGGPWFTVEMKTKLGGNLTCFGTSPNAKTLVIGLDIGNNLDKYYLYNCSFLMIFVRLGDICIFESYYDIVSPYFDRSNFFEWSPCRDPIIGITWSGYSKVVATEDNIYVRDRKYF